MRYTDTMVHIQVAIEHIVDYLYVIPATVKPTPDTKILGIRVASRLQTVLLFPIVLKAGNYIRTRNSSARTLTLRIRFVLCMIQRYLHLDLFSLGVTSAKRKRSSQDTPTPGSPCRYRTGAPEHSSP